MYMNFKNKLRIFKEVYAVLGGGSQSQSLFEISEEEGMSCCWRLYWRNLGRYKFTFSCSGATYGERNQS